jgi:hypothetical protein
MFSRSVGNDTSMVLDLEPLRVVMAVCITMDGA